MSRTTTAYPVASHPTRRPGHFLYKTRNAVRYPVISGILVFMPAIFRENEKIITQVSYHGIFLMPLLIFWTLILAFASWLVFGRFTVTLGNYWWIALLILAVTAGLQIGYRVFLWRKSLLILTDQRILDVNRSALFEETVLELLYRDALEVTYNRTGFFAILFDFGDLTIRTASKNIVVARRIPNPRKLIELINEKR